MCHYLCKAYYRRRRHSKVFITAVYVCAKGYELRDVDKLYCSQKHWIGKLPVCERIENKGNKDKKKIIKLSI